VGENDDFVGVLPRPQAGTLLVGAMRLIRPEPEAERFLYILLLQECLEISGIVDIECLEISGIVDIPNPRGRPGLQFDLIVCRTRWIIGPSPDFPVTRSPAFASISDFISSILKKRLSSVSGNCSSDCPPPRSARCCDLSVEQPDSPYIAAQH
jgi:hypothetical protein